MCGTKSGQLLAHAGKPLVHRLCIRVEVGEQEAVEVLDAHFAQADFAFVEARHNLDVGTRAKLA
jgi:hypothetical protein